MSTNKNEIHIEKRVHPVWTTYEKVDKETFMQYGPSIGKYQYIISSPKGKISVVELPDYFHNGVTFWELYCLEGDHFDDIDKFHSYKEAEQTARKYLE